MRWQVSALLFWREREEVAGGEGGGGGRYTAQPLVIVYRSWPGDTSLQVETGGTDAPSWEHQSPTGGEKLF